MYLENISIIILKYFHEQLTWNLCTGCSRSQSSDFVTWKVILSKKCYIRRFRFHWMKGKVAWATIRYNLSYLTFNITIYLKLLFTHWSFIHSFRLSYTNCWKWSPFIFARKQECFTVSIIINIIKVTY